MPLGIQRLNAKKSQPNDRIVFLKPLKGADEAIARDFLERIAAQCLPIMKDHHLSVMSLEEYEPNAEFVGRNFNAGEVIQLVLKARFTGHWLPFDYVQMVMMHELAHCKQMNHSRAFWAVRNQYAEQMRGLWSRGYTGEGLWGRGALLRTGEFETNGVQPGEMLPEHLCGGTYRSRGRKRKAKRTLTYQEQKERRILKKFGANGVALGDDAEAKRTLEKGRRVTAKPRVAGSKRGRELRAAAALARFDQQKEEDTVEVETASGEETDSGSDDYEDDLETDAGASDAVDLDGKRLLDAKGRGMIKVCEDENPDDGDAQNELLELRSFSIGRKPVKLAAPAPPILGPALSNAGNGSKSRMEAKSKQSKQSVADRSLPGRSSSMQRNQRILPTAEKPWGSKDPPTEPIKVTVSSTCSVCSFVNDKMAPTCVMCSNVLHLRNMAGAWACSSQICRGSNYRNAADCGVCGVCGQRKAVQIDFV